MYCDFVLCIKDEDIKKFAKRLGFFKLIYKEEFIKEKLFISKDYNINRKQVERKNIKILVNPHINEHKDHLHFRLSGLDQVLCKLMNQNKISLGISLDSLDNPIMLGRVKQNVKLCRKYKVKIKFFSFAKDKYGLRAVNDIISFCRILGMTGKEAKEALTI